MTRVNLLLLVALVMSALYLVSTQYDSRRLFTELERDKSEAHKLELDNERLRLEIRSKATPLRVEALAKSQLKMRTTTPAITQYVKAPAGALEALRPLAPKRGQATQSTQASQTSQTSQGAQATAKALPASKASSQAGVAASDASVGGKS